MAKRSSLILIIVLVSGLIVASIFLVYYKTSNKNTAAPQKNAAEATSPQGPAIDPSSLDWEEAVVSAPWEARDSQALVVYKNKIWLMGGVDASKRVISPGNIDYGNSPHLSDVWSSDDGINWQLVTKNAPWGKRRSIQVVDFKGKIWLMGGYGPEVGYKNDIWSSEDGAEWKREVVSAPWPAREGHQLLVFQDKIWLIGGVRYTGHKLFTDVWYSPDGINWMKATQDAGWSPRWDFAATSFNNKLWVMGGMDFDDNIYKDIWSSSDGINWSLVNGKPPFAAREGGGLVDYKNKLWVVGRLNVPMYGGGANDVWYSDDGISWQKTKNDPAWEGREDFGAVIFKDKIWIFGGMDKNWSWKNDVWYSVSNLDSGS